MTSFLERVCCGGWCTRWGASEEIKEHYPPRHTDFRDHTPEQLQTAYELYKPVVQDGRWTEGLLEMWFWKNKAVKASVHIPCWNSFSWNPLRWRGWCFGRTLEQCYWTGLRQTRWARAVYAANLGREYTMPFASVGRHGYKSDIKALCWMYCLLSCISSCGIGQLMTCCGSFLIVNFGAWFSCHARERLRRRYNLPPTFCLPPGIDDCLVHFFCFYCASHQELRELALRGVDGPGMHILDVLPNAFPTAPGIEEAKAQRQKVLERMLARPPKMFRGRMQKPDAAGRRGMHQRVADAAEALAQTSVLPGDSPELVPPAEQEAALSESASSWGASDDERELGAGWLQYAPPPEQEMGRGRPSVEVAPLPAVPQAVPLPPARQVMAPPAPEGASGVTVVQWLGARQQQAPAVQSAPAPEPYSSSSFGGRATLREWLPQRSEHAVARRSEGEGDEEAHATLRAESLPRSWSVAY